MQRQELIDAVHKARDDAERVASDLHEDGWNTQVHGPEGWNVKQVYSHLAAMASACAMIARDGLHLPPDFNVDAMNAQAVGERENKRVLMVMAEIDTGLREFAQQLHKVSDEHLIQQVANPIQPGTTISLIEILNFIGPLHFKDHLDSVEAALKPA